MPGSLKLLTDPGSSASSPPHPLNGLLNIILTTIQGSTITLAGILEDQKQLSDSIIELQQKSFTIEGSAYSVYCGVHIYVLMEFIIWLRRIY